MGVIPTTEDKWLNVGRPTNIPSSKLVSLNDFVNNTVGYTEGDHQLIGMIRKLRKEIVEENGVVDTNTKCDHNTTNMYNMMAWKSDLDFYLVNYNKAMVLIRKSII